MNMLSTIRQFVVSFIALGAVLLIASVVSAWTGPTGTAPNSNAYTPLNISATAQTKTGGLLLNTGGAVNGLIVQSGKVGVGVTAPAQKLDVAGNVKASGFCIGTACITSWPTDASTELLDSNYCYATRAGRTKSPSCAGGYYLKAVMGYRDSDWDGVGGVCCLSQGSSDPRMTATVKNTLVTNADALSITFDKTYDQIVSLCLADPSQFKINGGGDTVTCPKTDPL
ncbi:hypothetical protein A2704_06250 [Candidatus Kaiserbacteria bacterium RIFCSPHIGHO2_01_FULL_54_36b]|uniref:Uncharacterized protein n=1 Tax=Candidatus Kaiserbacteria bacterium RIFCSPHIGHO2_01_FULL_54_36b TaxID=1798483 RepID=A0A1F6CKE4_9BACT|nr:MAG: hypothetical protein A2704_06250 [Candidatus Kaiserbacteria bacterium RIFCSPHIGHO2_01_FULL_54_36b]